MEPETLWPLLKHLESGRLISVSAVTSDKGQVVALSESGRAMAQEARAIYDQVRCAVDYGPSEFNKMKHGRELLREKLTQA